MDASLECLIRAGQIDAAAVLREYAAHRLSLLSGAPGKQWLPE